MTDSATPLPPPGSPQPPAALVLSAVAEGLGTLTLNNPRRRNALSRAMLQALQAALADFTARPEVRVVILAANGPVFSAGHDMRELVGTGEGETEDLFGLCVEVMEQIRACPKPVIARVHGLASAAGCQLAATCDLVVASREAAFQTPGVKIGLFCSTPMVPLSRAVAPKAALEMLLTGEPMDAEAARAAGLVNRVVDPAALTAETEALARHITQYAAATLALGKAAFYRQLGLDVAGAYAVGREAMTCNALLDDAQEGMSAFLEKRPPRWRT